MVDIHAHIYPGIDDGSADMVESLLMVRAAAESGVKKIAATPHCNLPGFYGNYLDETWEWGLQNLIRQVQLAEIPVEILPGMEIYGTDGLADMLAEGRLLGLNRTDYVLVEFSFQEDPVRIYHWISELRRAGYRPVLAHPERYGYVQADIRLIFDWRDMGCAVQVNKGSILGRFGRYEYETAWKLLEEGLADCVASDAHSSRIRTASMTEVRDVLTAQLGIRTAERLLRDNPERILAGERL